MLYIEYYSICSSFQTIIFQVAKIAPENVYDIMEGKLDKFKEADK